MNNKQTRLIPILLLVGFSILSLNFLSISKQTIYEPYRLAKTPSEVRDCKWDCLGRRAECMTNCEYRFQSDLPALRSCKQECNYKKRECESYCM